METGPQPDPAARDHLMQLERLRASHYYEVARNRRKVISDLSQLGLRLLVLLNGGAIVALFTVLGHADQVAIRAPWLIAAFSAYAVGVLAGFAALILGFLASNAFGLSEQHTADRLFFLAYGDAATAADEEKKCASELRKGTPLWWSAVGAASVGMAMFAVGSGLALFAVHLRS